MQISYQREELKLKGQTAVKSWRVHKSSYLETYRLISKIKLCVFCFVLFFFLGEGEGRGGWGCIFWTSTYIFTAHAFIKHCFKFANLWFLNWNNEIPCFCIYSGIFKLIRANFTPFQANVHFLYPQKTSENQRSCFQGV